MITGATSAATSDNIGFEYGNFSNWVGYTWIYRTDYPAMTTSPQKGIVDGWQTIMKDTTAYDEYTGYKLKKIPMGRKYSARLGCDITGGRSESLSYTLKVDETNALLIWRFAVVLQNPLSNHLIYEEPRFKISLIDENGDTIRDCTNYDVHASDASISGFQTYYKSSGNPILWRDWTAVGANLLPYLGHKVTIEFMAADCSHQNHFGYAYFVAETHPMIISVQYCSGDSYAKLIAPDGFSTYVWTDSIGTKVGTAQNLVLTSPNEGARYYCSMTSATGCQVTLNSKILRYEPNADFKYDIVDCNNLTNTMKFSNLHPAKNGTLEYNWNFGDGSNSTTNSPTHTFTTSGLHQVKLVVSNPPSTCKDSVTKTVETFYPPLVGIDGDSLYCSGSTTTLKGKGAYAYKWSNGSTADSIVVGSDQSVWMIGYSSIGCYTDTIRMNVKKAPDWTFNLEGNPLFCKGKSTTLSGTDAASYLWNTGAKTKSLTIDKAGIYTLTGTNTYGCSISQSVQVVEDPLPVVDFSLSRATVDERHNTLTCTLTDATSADYVWDMGDGETETGATIQHTYKVNNELPEYHITVTATNSNSCVNSNTKSVEIVPFIPNVFSPNGDGINDLFVAGMQAQIIDRYGMLVYSGNKGWDGTFNGKRLDNDTYFYQITYTDLKGIEHKVKGNVTLKR